MLNLLVDLKREFGLTYLFISHDLNVVRYISDRVLVMYLGEVVELGPVDQVWDAPRASLYAGAAGRDAVVGSRSAAPRRRRSRAIRPIRSIRRRAAASTPAVRLRSRSAQTPLQNSPRSIVWAIRRRATWPFRAPATAARRQRHETEETRMTRPSRRRSRRWPHVAGVPVDAEVAARIANSIGPAFEGFAAGRRHAAVRSRARDASCSCRPRRCRNEQRARPDVADRGRQGDRRRSKCRRAK